MHITIDGKRKIFTEDDSNIVEVAGRAGIIIPAPCYRSKQKDGCCKACVIEIEGKQAYACGTKPADGMTVTVNRDDLKAIRNERIKEYTSNIDKGCACNCDCNTETSATESCC